MFSLEDVPPHIDNDPRYNITEVHWRTVHGKLLWTEQNRFKRLHRVGDVVIENKIALRIRRVAVADNVQHINVEPD